VLVRHGQSEGNEATARSEKGDLSCYTPEFQNKHSSTYRLTDKGIKQAKVTLASSFTSSFTFHAHAHRCFCAKSKTDYGSVDQGEHRRQVRQILHQVPTILVYCFILSHHSSYHKSEYVRAMETAALLELPVSCLSDEKDKQLANRWDHPTNRMRSGSPRSCWENATKERWTTPQPLTRRLDLRYPTHTFHLISYRHSHLTHHCM